MGIKRLVVYRGDAVDCTSIVIEIFRRIIYIDIGFSFKAYRYRRESNGDVKLL